MAEMIGGWELVARERNARGRWVEVALCPECRREVRQPKSALRVNKRCQACFLSSVRIDGKSMARGKVKHNLFKIQGASRGLEVSLSDEQLSELWASDCFYCGQPPSNKMTARRGSRVEEFMYSGLDRVDNEKGYTFDNVVPCCKICNGAKSKLTAEEFYDWVVRLANNIENLYHLSQWEGSPDHTKDMI